MSAHIQTLLLAITLGFVYWWLQVPALSFYSLQAFAVSVVLYFIAKRISKAKIWHIAPAAQSFEMVLATFAFMILIGFTGNFESILFPLTYIHLFFLVFSTHLTTSIITTLLLITFHYALGGGAVSVAISETIAIPIMLVFFLFTKHQYSEVIRERKIIENDEKALSNSLEKQTQITNLVTKFIQPKLAQIKDLSLHASQNRDAIIGQIFIMQMEISKFLERNRDD
jgi:hypothetical protein